MAAKRSSYINPDISARREDTIPTILLGAKAAEEDKFSVSEEILNVIKDNNNEEHKFPGNISLEGYFYSPFYEVTLKELDDVPQYVRTRRINFIPCGSTVSESAMTFYNPEMGIFNTKTLYIISIISPSSYGFMVGRPFSIYDVLEERTLRGHLDSYSENERGGFDLKIATESKIEQDWLDGTNGSGKSRYIISLLDENAPEYAEYIPSSGKLVWRAPKKMSDLESTSSIYNMPFTNGRLYIHKNINVFVRRQDPHNDFYLFRPSYENPLRRFQVEGDAKLDFDYIKQIIDSMVDAC